MSTEGMKVFGDLRRIKSKHKRQFHVALWGHSSSSMTRYLGFSSNVSSVSGMQTAELISWSSVYHHDGLMQERRNSGALAMQFRLSCTNPSICVCCLSDHLLLIWLTFIPAWISNHMPNKVWDEITNPFPNFNSFDVEVLEWVSNFIPQYLWMQLLVS